MAEFDLLEQAFKESLSQEEALEKSFVDPQVESDSSLEQAFQEEINNENALDSSLDQTLHTSPDENAQIRELSRKTGYPEEAVEEDKKLFEQQARREEIKSLMTPHTPATGKFLSDPKFAGVAHDEAEALADIEAGSKNVTIGQALGLGVDSLQIGLYGGVEAFSRYAGVDTIADAARTGRERNENEAAAISPHVKQFTDIKTVGDFASFVKTGLPQVAPSLAAMGAAGYSAAAIATALGITVLAPAAVATLGVLSVAWLLGAGGIQSQIQQAAPGIEGTEDVAIVGGLGVGLLDAIIPGKAAGSFAKNLGKKGLLRSITEMAKRGAIEGAKSVPVEGLTEGVQSTIENVATASATGKPLDMEKVWEDFKNEGALGALGGGSFSSVTSVINDVASARTAVANEEVMKEISQKIQDLSLTKRDFQAAVEFEMKVLQEQKIDDISIPVDKLIEFAELSEQTLEDMGLAEQAEQAGVAAGDVRLSQRQYAEFFLASEQYDSVAENIRLGESEMTAAEAREFETSDLPEALEKLAPLETEDDADITLTKTIPLSTLRDEGNVLFPSDILDRETIEKTGSTEEFEKLKADIEKEGIKEPVSIRIDDKGKVNVVDGANRLLAAEELGITDVPVKFTDDSVKSGAAEKFVGDLAPVEKEVGDIESQVREDAILAENEAGLKALFQTADESGQTPKQYESYLVAIQRASEGRVKRETLRREKRALKEATTALNEATVKMRQKVQDEVEQRPEYRALDFLKAGGRIDQDAIFSSDFLGEPFDIGTLEKFPKIGNKVIYGPVKKGEDVFHPDLLADLVGLSSGDELLKVLFESRPIKEVIVEEADLRIAKEQGELPQKVADIQASIERLYVDETANILALELNALRVAQKQGRLKPALIKNAAEQEMKKYSLRDISVTKFSRAAKRQGALAGKLLRKGDRKGATSAKFAQLVNFYLAQQAFQVKHDVKAQQKYLKKVAKKPKLGGKKAHDLLPPDYSDAIRAILDSYGLGGSPAPEGFDLADFQQQEFDDGVAFELPAPGDPNTDVKDLPLHAFNKLVQDIKTIENSGITKTKVSRSLKAEAAQEIVNGLVLQMVDTIDPRKARKGKDNVKNIELTPIKEEVLDNIVQTALNKGADAATLLFNMDTMLREIDGWQDLGPAYEAIKGPIDDAISNGYKEGQVGYNIRQKEMLAKVEDLLASHYTMEERANFKRELNIPGVTRAFTKHEVLSILLNSGNAENIAALTDGEKRALSAEELDNLREQVDEKDLDFAQATWDYIDSYWSDISESTIRRKNFKPEKVIAQPFEVKGKTYQGGYYPLRYDGDSLSVNDEVASVDDIRDRVLFGAYIGEHTSADHIEVRKGNARKAVNLDPFIVTTHLQRVIYDLEVGEAVSDSYKILHHRDFKGAFERMGRANLWKSMDLWFRSTVTGEISRGGIAEKTFRHIRNGISISALGFNLGVAALQPLGIFPAAILIGKERLIKSTLSVLSSMVSTNPTEAIKAIGNQTKVMKERSFTFNKDINDFKRAFRKGKTDLGKTGAAKRFIDKYAFIPIVGMQKFADVVIWQAAYSKGMEKFANNDVQAKRYADRMVIRTQGSGNFQERTPVEQGTVNKNINQTELVKAFSLFMVYFAAKTNVVYEAIKSNKKKSTVKGAAKLASDLALAFVYETVIVMLIKGQIPDEDDDESKFGAIAKEVAGSTVAGVPLVRDIAGAVKGFSGGGTIGSIGETAKKLFDEIGQEETDEGLFIALAKVLGIALHLPTGQPIKTTRAELKRRGEGEIEVMEYVLGPKFEK